MSNLTVGLQDFIRTSGVVPPQFQLEFLERMGNLCTYSGQPMTPDFKLWLERKFGLQFVRAVQDFSTWDIPKLTPDTVRLLSLYFPNQYRGVECRLAFIRLFDVTCDTPELCLYEFFAEAGALGWGMNSGFIKDGIDGPELTTNALQYQNMILELQAAFPNLIFGSSAEGSAGDFSTGQGYWWILLEQGQTPPDWYFFDGQLSNPTQINFTEVVCGNYTPLCFQISIPEYLEETLELVSVGYDGPSGSLFTFINSPNSNQFSPDWITFMVDLLQSICGNQATVISTINGDTLTITVNNTYVSLINANFSRNFIGEVINFNEIPC